MLDFWFGFFVLTILRLNRRNTWLGLGVSLLSGFYACCFGSEVQPGGFLFWLASAALVTTLAGLPDRTARLAFFPLLLPLSNSSAGLIGLLTGFALNLPLLRRKLEIEKETYGIKRVS